MAFSIRVAGLGSLPISQKLNIHFYSMWLPKIELKLQNFLIIIDQNEVNGALSHPAARTRCSIDGNIRMKKLSIYTSFDFMRFIG